MPSSDIARIQATSAQASGAGTSIAATLNGVAVGNFVLAFVYIANTANISNVRDDLTVNAVRANQFNWAADGAWMEHWYFKNHGGGNRTFTGNFSASVGFRTIEVVEYSGVDTVAPADTGKTSTGTGTSTTPATGAVLPSEGNALFVGTAAATSTAAPVAAKPFNQAVSEAVNFNTTEDYVQATPQSQVATWTQGSSLLWGAILTVFLPQKYSAPGADLPTSQRRG
jgi:hypothetical protein